MKKSILTVLLALITSISFSQSGDYKLSLKKLLQVSGSERTYTAAIVQMTTMFRQQQANVPAEFWDEFAAEANKDAFNMLFDLMLPIYQKHLTETDLLDIIAFYETPTGKRYAEKTPLIMQESMLAGQEWGKMLGQKVADKLKAKGYAKEQ